VIARIYSADEARALREALTPRMREQMEAREPEWNRICSRIETCEIFAASPDLAASVEHHAARADAAEQECARLRAMVAELESLATGPRGLVVDDAACAAIDGTASIGPQGVDATEREVLP